MSRHTFARKMRVRRDLSQFNRAMRNAPPSQQQEMMALAAYQSQAQH